MFAPHFQLAIVLEHNLQREIEKVEELLFHLLNRNICPGQILIRGISD